MTAAPSFLWHDYETSGTDPRRERPTQFACWRTDLELNPLAEPETVYCQPSPDLLPDPESCLLTGLLPDELAQRGLVEPEFAAFVHERMAEPGTCNTGYNSMRFDDEVSRHLFWRQFHDPYSHEWAQGNSRFDLIDVMRMAYALRPAGMQWPRRDDGLPTFKLDQLAAANAVQQARAHDATDDVIALVGLARRLKTAQPRLWQHALGLRSKVAAAALLDLESAQPLVHVSQRFAAQRGCLAVVVPLLRHPRFAGRIVVVDLDPDPAGWVHASAEQLAERLFARADSGLERIPVKAVHLNRAPMLAPLSVLRDVDATRIALDVARCLRHLEQVRAAADLPVRLAQALQLTEAAATTTADVDVGLYDGFIEGADRAICQRVLKADPQTLDRRNFRFTDARLHELLLRRQARWFPQTLSVAERGNWSAQVLARLGGDGGGRSLQQFDARIDDLRQARPDQHSLLERLVRWRNTLFPATVSPV